jgi:polysaccharide export outer membrane protein
MGVLFLTAVSVALCQQPRESPPPALSQAAEPGQKGTAVKDVLRINDQLIIFASDVPGMNDRPLRIEPDGTVTLPLVGRVRAEGLTVDEFRKELVDQFKVYVRSPQVSVKLLLAEAATAADTIVIAGAFRNPGVHALAGRRTLLQVVSEVGGLQPNAGTTIKVTRRLDRGRLPLPSGTEDPVSNVSTAIINYNRLIGNPAGPENLIVEPNDILSADPAGSVFLTGEVLRPGPFGLNERESVGLTELVSQAGGFSRDAAPEKTKILREILNGTKRAEITVDIRSILDGRSFDFPVQSNDIVVVPRRRGTGTVLRSVVLYAVPIVTSAVLYSTLRR